MLIKNKKISHPRMIEFTNSEVNVILVSNYKFVAEDDNELSINKGDLLKFIDRKDKGWILVKFLDKLDSAGLIPASYVDIVINDIKKPINLNWLKGEDNNGITKDIRDLSDPVPLRSSQRSQRSKESTSSTPSPNKKSYSLHSSQSSQHSSTSYVKKNIPNFPVPNLPHNNSISNKFDYQRSKSSPLLMQEGMQFKRSNSEKKPLRVNTEFNQYNIPPSPVSPEMFKMQAKFNDYSFKQTEIATENANEDLNMNDITSVTITNCLTHDSRYWYRVDIKTSTKRISLGKFYQDFYNLQLNLLQYKGQSLPKLPDPISINETEDEMLLIKTLIKRCQELNLYVNKLYMLKFPEFLDWLKISNNKLHLIQNGETNDEINQKILPGSINLIYKKISVKIILYNNDLMSLNLNKQELFSINDLKFKIKQTVNFKNLLYKTNEKFEPIENINIETIRKSEKILLRLS